MSPVTEPEGPLHLPQKLCWCGRMHSPARAAGLNANPPDPFRITGDPVPDLAETDDPYARWSILEMMGHRRVAGFVTADGPVMSATRLRIDIYAGEAEAPAVTQFVPYPAAVYCLTPTTEAVARGLGARLMPAPVSRYELEPPKPRDPQAEWDNDRPYDD